MFEKARALGYWTALLSSKEKIRRLLNKGADLAISAPNPSKELVKGIGKSAGMYTPDVNYWLFRSLQWILKGRKNKDEKQLIYVATTDYMMHTYAPGEERSQIHLRTLDEMLGQIVNEHPNIELYLTADHGMNAKTDAIDLTKILAAEKLAAKAVPIIKDRHVVHHKNMGGASYVYLDRHDQLEDTLSFLRSSKGIGSVHTKQEAVEIFHLHPDRIGDLLVLGNVPVAFGHLKSEREEIKIRTHGSRFESTVPLLAYGTSHQASEFQYNFDVVRRLQL